MASETGDLRGPITTIKNALFGRGLRICYAAAFTVGTGLAIFSAAPAQAAGTLADTLVSNTVTLTYSVGGVEQTDNPTDTADFEVDRMIDLQVSGETSPTATPGDTEGVLVYTLENQGNATQAYDLAAVNGTNITPTAIWIDDGDGVFDDTQDTLYIPGSNDPELAPDGTATIFIIGTVSDTLADGATVSADLVATTLEPNGSTYGTAGDPVVESPTTAILVVDTVFVDENYDGTYTTDVAEDGIHSDIATATVAKATLTVDKSVIVITRDPAANCATATQVANAEQFAIPGACIQYTLEVCNAASPAVPVTDVLISDALPAEITWVAFDLVNGDDFTAAGDVAPAHVVNGGDSEVSGDVTATKADIAPDSCVSLIIRATIN